MDTKQAVVTTARKSGTHRILLRPGKRYGVYYIARPSRNSDWTYLPDAIYLGIRGSILYFKLPNDSERQIHAERIRDIRTFRNESYADREALLDKWRAQREARRAKGEAVQLDSSEGAGRYLQLSRNKTQRRDRSKTS